MSDYRSDSMIADEVADRLATFPGEHRILASVQDGRVTLRGSVADVSLRRAIKDEVADIDGVSAITDLLRVSSGAQESHATSPAAPSPVTPINRTRRQRLQP